jgi:hypothetical protein
MGRLRAAFCFLKEEMDTNPTPEVAAMDSLLAELDKPQDDDLPDSEQADDAADEQEQQPEAEAEDATDEAESQDSQEQPADEVEEVEVDGKKHRVPKAIAEIVAKRDSFQADYTRKTQEVAEKKRAVEDKEQFLEARTQFLTVAGQELAELQALQKQFAQFQTVDWNALIATDHAKALQLTIARNNLTSEIQTRTQKLQGIAAQAEEARKKHKAEQMKLNQGELERRVGRLTPKDTERLMEAAQELGFDESLMWRPEALHALDLASKYLALQKQKPQAMKKVAEAPRAVKPQAPRPRAENQEAVARLKKFGRGEDLMKLL